LTRPPPPFSPAAVSDPLGGRDRPVWGSSDRGCTEGGAPCGSSPVVVAATAVSNSRETRRAPRGAPLAFSGGRAPAPGAAREGPWRPSRAEASAQPLLLPGRVPAWRPARGFRRAQSAPVGGDRRRR